jgi:hypothetical protein
MEVKEAIEIVLRNKCKKVFKTKQAKKFVVKKSIFIKIINKKKQDIYAAF